MENMQDMQAAMAQIYSPQYASERFDKQALVHLHDSAAQDQARLRAEAAKGKHVADSSAPSVALQGLQPIRLRDLQVGRTHHGRVLYGTLCVNPLKFSGIMTVLEDDQGLAVRVTIYNTPQSVQLSGFYPNGAKVAIKEPYFKTAMDGSLAIRVENPANLERVAEFPAENQQQRVVPVDLEEERSKGNECFRNQDWHGGVIHYTACINAAANDDEATRNTLLLAYSNRAETRLRMGEFESALGDSNKGLEIDPGHLKTLCRKGRALQGLKNYGQASEVLQKALDLAPGRPDVEEAFRHSKVLYAQSRQGKYDISDTLLRRKPPADVGDFVGDVEIKMTKDGRGRGLFAAKSIDTGELFLVSNAVAIAHDDDRAVKLMKFDRANINTNSQEDLVAAVIDAANKSQKLLQQLYALDDGSPQFRAPVPAMELFQTDNLPQATATVNVNRIRDIIARNSFGGEAQTYAIKSKTDAEKLISNEGFSGLWLLPSFINHSCLPNATRLNVGNAMFLHAAKPIKKGEEITITYIDTLVPRPQRKAICRAWGFNCQCKRCGLEKILKTALEPLNAHFEAFHDRALEETNAAKFEGQELPTDLPVSAVFAEVYEKLEETLAKYPRMKEEEKNWLRASFVSAYWAGIQSNEFFPKTLEDPIPSGDEMLQAVVNTVPGDVRTLVMAANHVEGLKHWTGGDGWAVEYCVKKARDACIRVMGKHSEDIIQEFIVYYGKCAIF